MMAYYSDESGYIPLDMYKSYLLSKQIGSISIGAPVPYHYWREETSTGWEEYRASYETPQTKEFVRVVEAEMTEQMKREKVYQNMLAAFGNTTNKDKLGVYLLQVMPAANLDDTPAMTMANYNAWLLNSTRNEEAAKDSLQPKILGDITNEDTTGWGNKEKELLQRIKGLEILVQSIAKASVKGMQRETQQQGTLLLDGNDIVKNKLRAKAKEWWETHNDAAMMLGEKLQPGRKAILLEQYLKSPEIAREVANEAGVDTIEVSYATRSMLAAGASALMMMLSGGNFPLGAAAYFGVNAAIPSGGKDMPANLFDGVLNPEGATINGQPVVPMDVQIPEGLPNEVFINYRYICYDRLSGRWFPSDEIRPLEYDSNEQYRWMCLDRVSGKVYKANLIKKARIYLQ